MVGTGGTIGSGQEPVRVNNLTPRLKDNPTPSVEGASRSEGVGFD